MQYSEKDGPSQGRQGTPSSISRVFNETGAGTDGPTPYLGLQARLSQIWFNRWTVLLLLVLVRVLLLLGGLNDDLGDAKIKALSACTKVEDIGSAMASMPHYLSVGVNALTATGVTKAVHALMSTVDMILTAVKALILFVIGMLTDTYVCLISLVVHGSLEVASTVIEKATDQINNVIGGAADSIEKLAGGFEDTVNKLLQGVTDIGKGVKDGLDDIFGRSDAPTLDLTPDLDKIKNFKIDAKPATQFLDNLNDKLPDFDDVKRYTSDAVSIPFDLAKKALNDSYGNWKFDESVFPVAQKESLSFCSENSAINEFFDTLFNLAKDAKKAFIAIISILAVLACVPMAYWEIRRWNRLSENRKLFATQGHDTMDFMMMSARPLTSRIGLTVSEKLFRGSTRRRNLFRWCVAYGTSLPALFILSLAIAGFFSCFCQVMLLKAIEKEVPALADQVGDFAGEVVTTLQHVSEDWANDANGVIISFSDDINKDVLGYVTNATTAVNDTLNTFTDQIDKGLTFVFKDTPLMDPVKGLVNCIIGIKIDNVQKGLTWVHDNAKVNFPLFPNDTFSAGAQKSVGDDSDLNSFLTSPSSATTDELTDAVNHVTTRLHNGIIQEALISTGILLVYVLIVMIGVIRTLIKLPGAGGRDEPQTKEDPFDNQR